MDNELPEALLKEFPQLEQIHAAIAEFRETGEVTVRCPECGEVLQVAIVPGRIVVGCPCGHCRYSARFDPEEG